MSKSLEKQIAAQRIKLDAIQRRVFQCAPNGRTDVVFVECLKLAPASLASEYDDALALLEDLQFLQRHAAR